MQKKWSLTAALLACAVAVPAHAFEITAVQLQPPATMAPSFEELFKKREFVLKLEAGPSGVLYATFASHWRATVPFGNRSLASRELLRIKDYSAHMPHAVVETRYAAGKKESPLLVRRIELETFVYQYDDLELEGSAHERQFWIVIGYDAYACNITNEALLAVQVQQRDRNLVINEAYIGNVRINNSNSFEGGWARSLADVRIITITVCPLEVNDVDVREDWARELSEYALSK